MNIDSTDYHISKDYSDRIAGTFGAAGLEWLQRLPQILKAAADRWSIKLLPPFQPLSYNYVSPAIKVDGTPVVLKAGVPEREFRSEIDALRHFGGQGMVRLLEADYDSGLMLLERIVPGDPLQAIRDDEQSTLIFANVMRRLRDAIPDDHSFPSVTDWARGFQRLRDRFGGSSGPFPGQVIDRAEALMSELISSMSNRIVLHGDLHHWNILSAEREPWLALDPQGVVGEKEYEVGAWLRNPFPHILKMPEPKALIARRVDQLVDILGFDRYRITAWAYSQAVLAGIWSFEEGESNVNGWLIWADEISALL
jgi:streptomycin 6-kinase